jgi:predicted metalloendopeptidase
VCVLQIDQGALGMPSRDYFLKGRADKTLLIYEELAVNIAVALGAERQRAEAEIAEMIDFEITLANVGGVFMGVSLCKICGVD